MLKKNRGFTLGEMLITLGIIGVVSALTIPIVVNNTLESETVTRVTKVAAIFEDALSSALANNNNLGVPDWVISTETGIAQEFADQMRVDKDCGTDGTACFFDGDYRDINGTAVAASTFLGSSPRYKIADGMSFVYKSIKSNCNSDIISSLDDACGVFIVDTNADNKPNRFGYDVFAYYLTPRRVVPFGGSNITGSFAASCLKEGEGVTSGAVTIHPGMGCTAWVFSNKKMDYIKKTDLAWPDEAQNETPPEPEV